MFKPTMTDSYKISHYNQYPKNTTKIYSYLESRGGLYPQTVFFGLQYYLLKYLQGGISPFYRHRGESLINTHLGKQRYNKAGWDIINNEYGGKLPITIKAVPEGTVVPIRNVLMTVENNDPRLYWLTNYVETLLSKIWYPITVATTSREIKKTIKSYLEKTGDPSGLDFKLHDFGYRGCSSEESACIGGASHLINFKGTDTLECLDWLQIYYPQEGKEDEVFGFSIDASEHSTITSWGQENEFQAFANMLDQNPEGLVACVSDSYDLKRACLEGWGGVLKEKVQNRKGILVVRPDSGDPTTIVESTCQWLGEAFGFSINEKGYKVLPPYIRVIQGDGINHSSIKDILNYLVARKWSADNVAFGMGGALLQQCNRDTQKFAFKCSWAEVNGEGRDVFKDPITDPGKISKKGRLKLVIDDQGDYKTVPESDPREDKLVKVFENGELLEYYNFNEIRNRANV